MAFGKDHELHTRRTGRNGGVALSLLAFAAIVFGLTVVFCLFVCSLAAFSFVFIDWGGKAIIFSVLLATLIIPYETIFIPLLLMASQLPWIGTEGLELNGDPLEWNGDALIFNAA